MTPSKIFLYFCLSFIIGIFISSFFHFSLILILSVFILGILLISVLWKNPAQQQVVCGAGKKLVVAGFCLILFASGIFCHQRAELSKTNNQLSMINNTEQEITLIGKVISEPDIRETNAKLTVAVNPVRNLLISNGVKEIHTDRPLHQCEKNLGKILVTTGRYPEYQYGDELKIIGELKTPIEFEDFNYKDYLAKDGIYSVMYYPKIISMESKKSIGVTYGFFAGILGFKDKLRQSIGQNLSPPQSSILGAMILGDKRKISKDWQQKLNIAGIRHITCISGMHIIILSGILMWLGVVFGLWRGQAFYFTMILLILFIIMVGAPPSAIRAGIMGGMLLYAQKIGRLRAADRAIVFAATVMLVFNPLLLKSDVGFQLSFLASLGIIYLMPIFQEKLRKIPIRSLTGILSMTLAAQVFTLPILIYNFGYVSLVAVFSNVLIVPVLPFVLGFGFLFALIGIILPFFGWFFSLPCWLLLTYITGIAGWFASFPWASMGLEISWEGLLISYLILGCITWHFHQKQKLKFLEY